MFVWRPLNKSFWMKNEHVDRVLCERSNCSNTRYCVKACCCNPNALQARTVTVTVTSSGTCGRRWALEPKYLMGLAPDCPIAGHLSGGTNRKNVLKRYVLVPGQCSQACQIRGRVLPNTVGVPVKRNKNQKEQGKTPRYILLVTKLVYGLSRQAWRMLR